MLQTTIYMYHNNTRDEKKKNEKQEMTEMSHHHQHSEQQAGGTMTIRLPPQAVTCMMRGAMRTGVWNRMVGQVLFYIF